MSKYISRKYLKEKIGPVEQLLKTIEEAESDNLTEAISDYRKNEIAFAFAVIAKELDVKIPDV